MRRLLHLGLATEDATGLSFRLSLDALRLHLRHKFVFKLLLLLGACALHRLLRSLDTLTVRPVLIVRATDPVPPAEARREVVRERHVVEVVVLCAGPEGKDVVQRPGEVVPTVRVDGLEEAQHNPEVDCDDVQVTHEVAVEEGSEDGASAKDEDLSGMRVLGGEAKGC